MHDESPLLTCPVCSGPLAQQPTPIPEEGCAIRCMNCGDHRVTIEALYHLRSEVLRSDKRAAVAHHVRKIPNTTLLTTDILEHLIEAATLPGALERIDNLVLYLAGDFRPGEAVSLTPKYLRAATGCDDAEAVQWVVDQALRSELICPGGPANATKHLLTAKGWERYSALLREGAGSRHAFMAMAFNTEMWDVLKRWMVPAVGRAGFELRTTAGEHQTAGSIDNRMRVEIRTSRFTVCDLTHGNRGAYWEAGFAEGLGRPVFYTCRADILKSVDPDTRVHFDTAHQLIIGWDPDDMAQGMYQLTSAIRATLPAEAKLSDETM